MKGASSFRLVFTQKLVSSSIPRGWMRFSSPRPINVPTPANTRDMVVVHLRSNSVNHVSCSLRLRWFPWSGLQPWSRRQLRSQQRKLNPPVRIGHPTFSSALAFGRTEISNIRHEIARPRCTSTFLCCFRGQTSSQTESEHFQFPLKKALMRRKCRVSTIITSNPSSKSAFAA